MRPVRRRLQYPRGAAFHETLFVQIRLRRHALSGESAGDERHAPVGRAGDGVSAVGAFLRDRLERGREGPARAWRRRPAEASFHCGFSADAPEPGCARKRITAFSVSQISRLAETSPEPSDESNRRM